MRLGDRVSGLLAMAFGAAVAISTRLFPSTSGELVGPAAFPATIGVVLVVAGALLLIRGLRDRHDIWIELPEWVRRPQPASSFALVLATVLVYAVVVDRLGFLITAFLLLATLFAAFGVRRTRIVPLALLVTLAIHFAFYTLLRVPLPWGVLEAVAW